MVSNADDDRTRANPFIRRFVRVIIIDGSPSGIAAIERFFCRSNGGFCNGFIKLTICNCSKCPRLIDHAGNGIWKRRVFHSIEYHCPYGNLSSVGFPTRFRRNDPRQQIDIVLGVSGVGRRIPEEIPRAFSVFGPAIPSTESPLSL